MVGKQTWTNLANKGDKPDWQYEGIDFIDAFRSMSNNEQSIIKFMKDSIKWDKEHNSLNYVVELSPDSVHFDPAADDVIAYPTFLKGYQLLFKRDLVRRTKRHHYMMNPAFFCVTGERTSYFESVWAESKQYLPRSTF